MDGPSARKRRKEDYTCFINIRRAIRDLEKVQAKIEKLNDEEPLEIRQVEKKYNVFKRPFYKRRSFFIQQIPDFWAKAIFHEPSLCDIIHDLEVPCVCYLRRLVVEEDLSLEHAFSIEFSFFTNPYFENTLLVKSLQLGAKGIGTSVSTPILWKANMNLQEKLAPIVAERRSQQEDATSFFTWFSENKDGMFDFYAHIIRDNFWPNARSFFKTDDEEDSGREKDEETGVPSSSAGEKASESSGDEEASVASDNEGAAESSGDEEASESSNDEEASESSNDEEASESSDDEEASVASGDEEASEEEESGTEESSSEEEDSVPEENLLNVGDGTQEAQYAQEMGEHVAEEEEEVEEIYCDDQVPQEAQKAEEEVEEEEEVDVVGILGVNHEEEEESSSEEEESSEDEGDSGLEDSDEEAFRDDEPPIRCL